MIFPGGEKRPLFELNIMLGGGLGLGGEVPLI